MYVFLKQGQEEEIGDSITLLPFSSNLKFYSFPERNVSSQIIIHSVKL